MLPYFFLDLLISESIYLDQRGFFLGAWKSSVDYEKPNMLFILSFLEIPFGYKNFAGDF